MPKQSTCHHSLASASLLWLSWALAAPGSRVSVNTTLFLVPGFSSEMLWFVCISFWTHFSEAADRTEVATLTACLLPVLYYTFCVNISEIPPHNHSNTLEMPLSVLPCQNQDFLSNNNNKSKQHASYYFYSLVCPSQLWHYTSPQFTEFGGFFVWTYQAPEDSISSFSKNTRLCLCCTVLKTYFWLSLMHQ